MLFYESSFIIGYAIFIALYFLIPYKQRNFLILLISYYFYGQWNYKLLSLLIISTLLDYFMGLCIGKTTKSLKKKLFLAISIVGNLGILCYFKYANFFIDSFTQLFPIGLESNSLILQVILPAGISFYTFQTMSYTIDVYRNQIMPEKNFIVFASFVTFFPQLVAGPIERAENLIQQLKVKYKGLYQITR